MKWKHHKYAKKIGDFYEYNITGNGYLRTQNSESKKAIDLANRAASLRSSAEHRMQTEKVGRHTEANRTLNRANRIEADSRRASDKSIKATQDYYSKSLRGIASNTISKGKTRVKKLFSNAKKKFGNTTIGSLRISKTKGLYLQR